MSDSSVRVLGGHGTGIPTVDIEREKTARAAPAVQAPVTKAPVSSASLSPSLLTQVLRSLYDATVRGFVRYAEKFIDNKLLRILYRLPTEAARKISELAIVNILEKRAVTSKEVITGFIRALEHIPATTLFEPNLFEGHIPRVLAGFGNALIRIATRTGFCITGAIERQDLSEKGFLDEAVSRSLLRAVYVDSSSPVISIGVRILEQALINFNLHIVKPLNRLFPNFNDLFVKKDSTTNEPMLSLNSVS